MRKLLLVLALALVLVPLFAAAALAQGQLIQCTSVLPCYGGKGDDKILERIGDGKNDQIVPLGGDDLILANKHLRHRRGERGRRLRQDRRGRRRQAGHGQRWQGQGHLHR
jgi:hypothetical protein